MTGAGTASSLIGWRPKGGGSSCSPQPAVKSAAASAAARQTRRVSVAIRDDLPVRPRAQRLVDVVVYRGPEELDVAVAVEEVTPLAVLAPERVDLGVGIARPLALAGVAQGHARAVLALADAAVGVEGVGGTGPEQGAGDRTDPGGLAAADVLQRRADAHGVREARVEVDT